MSYYIYRSTSICSTEQNFAVNGINLPAAYLLLLLMNKLDEWGYDDYLRSIL